MSNQTHKMLDGFPNESIAKITEVVRSKIEKMLRKKYSKNLVEFRVYRRSKFPYLVATKLKDGSYKMLTLQ
jgi:hypothetical protein